MSALEEEVFAKCEKIGIVNVRRALAANDSSVFKYLDVEPAKRWLSLQDAAAKDRSDQRGEESLSISRKSLLMSRIALMLSIIAIGLTAITAISRAKEIKEAIAWLMH